MALPASESLPRATKLWYTLGQLGEGIKNESCSYFLLFYYTNVLDLSGALAGLAYLISMVVDAVADPMMGVLTDHTRSRLGRRHPWIFGSALPLALSLYLVFAPPAGLSQGWLFAWMLVWNPNCPQCPMGNGCQFNNAHKKKNHPQLHKRGLGLFKKDKLKIA